MQKALPVGPMQGLQTVGVRYEAKMLLPKGRARLSESSNRTCGDRAKPEAHAEEPSTHSSQSAKRSSPRKRLRARISGRLWAHPAVMTCDVGPTPSTFLPRQTMSGLP